MRGKKPVKLLFESHKRKPKYVNVIMYMSENSVLKDISLLKLIYKSNAIKE